MFELETCSGHKANKSTKVLARVLDARLRAIGTTRIQWKALYYIGTNRGMTQIQLAEKLESRGAAITRLLDRMEKDGLITRVVDQANRRSKKLFLTEKGRELDNKGARIVAEFEKGLAQGLTEEDLASLERVLNQMVANALKMGGDLR